MRNNDQVSLGDLYGDILGDVRKVIVKESSKKTPDNAFSGKDQKPKLDGGPESADGFNKSLHDQIMDGYNNPSKNKVTKTSGGREATDYFGTNNKPKVTDEDEETNEEEECEDDTEDGDDSKKSTKKKEWVKPWEKKEATEEDEEEISESSKISTTKLNTNMSKQKLTFDQIYKKVLSENFGQEDETNDLDALGLDGDESDADLGDDFGGDEGVEDSVTFTLDRATAQTLIEVLQGALGDEEGEDDGLEDEGDGGLDFGDEGDDEGGLDFDEDEESGAPKAAADKKGAFQSKNNKVGGKVKPKGGKASSEVTDEVGTKTNASTTYKDGKNNKVNASLKQGAEFFK